jgi:hypothetical protein
VQLKEDDGRPTVWRQCECVRQGRADAEEQKPGPRQGSKQAQLFAVEVQEDLGVVCVSWCVCVSLSLSVCVCVCARERPPAGKRRTEQRATGGFNGRIAAGLDGFQPNKS